MRNSSAVTIGSKISYLYVKAKKSLMELLCDRYIKIKFEAFSLPEFAIHMKRNA